MIASASQLTWHACGRPAHRFAAARAEGVCATCAALIESGVALADIETPTTANHADYFRFASGHVCDACAWLYDAGKGRPGNYLAVGERHEYTVISLESVVTDKRPWIVVLPEIAALPADTPVAGVMTTDVKPRLWPRARLATVGRFGLYLHAPDYDVSEWREFDLGACCTLIQSIIKPLTAGYAKVSLYHGLWRDHARCSRDPARAADWEAELVPHRGAPHYLPALIAAGVTKEQKQDVKSTASTTGYPDSPAARGDRPHQAQLGLF